MMATSLPWTDCTKSCCIHVIPRLTTYIRPMPFARDYTQTPLPDSLYELLSTNMFQCDVLVNIFRPENTRRNGPIPGLRIHFSAPASSIIFRVCHSPNLCRPRPHSTR